MKFLLQILFFFLTWFTCQVNATPLIIKVVLPSYELTFSKTENVKEKNLVKIGFQNFAKSEITENEPQTIYLQVGTFLKTLFSNDENGKFSALTFEKDLSKSQYSSFNFSKKEQLGLFENRAREVLEEVVQGVGNAIPNLLNKVDNVIDDIGNASLQVADVTAEIVKGSNSLSDVAKKFWANHEVNCTKYLRETYGNANVGRQITVDVTLSNGQVVTCRLDNLVKQGNTYKIPGPGSRAIPIAWIVI